MGENFRGKLHPDADIHTVGLGGNVHVTADGLHPFAAAAPHGNHALAARKAPGFAGDLIPAIQSGYGFHRRVEVKRDLFFQVGVEIFQHHVVDVGAEVAHRGVQQMQIVLHTQLFEFCTGGGIELGAFAAVGHVDLVNVAHQLQRFCLAEILVKRTAKIVGNVVFSVGKSACAAKSAHDRAAFAGNAGLDPDTVNGTFAVFQRVSGLKDGDLQFRAQPGQLIGGKDTAGPRADNDHIVIHGGSLEKSFCSQPFTAVGRNAQPYYELILVQYNTAGAGLQPKLTKKKPRLSDRSLGFLRSKNPRTVTALGLIGGGGRIRTIEAKRSRFTVCPLWPLGNSPIFCSFGFWLKKRAGSDGAGRRTRTPDLLITNQLLYQLSYTGVSNRTRLL